MKKTLNRFLYRFLKGEIENASDKDIITEKQANKIMDQYEVGMGFNYVWVLGTVGAVLIGLGFLLVVANNWEAIPDGGKLAILITAFLSAFFASHILKDKTEYTSRALLYTATLIFGSGIFLVVDAYDVSIEISTQMYIWTLGALLLSWYKKDIILFLFAHFLTFIFVASGFELVLFFHAIPLIAVLFAGGVYMFQKPITPYFFLVILLFFIFYTLDYADLDTFYTAWLMFVIGFAMKTVPHDWQRKAFKVMGILTMGITGFALSFSDLWLAVDLFGDGRVISIVFSILFTVYLLYQLTKKEIIPLIIVGALILRYYFDTLYDFLPRALFFVLGGLIIIAIGVFIERLSNKK